MMETIGGIGKGIDPFDREDLLSWSTFDDGILSFMSSRSLGLDDFDVSDKESEVRLEDNFFSDKLFSLETILLVKTAEDG